MTITLFDEWRFEGQRRMLELQLEKQFGPLSDAARHRLAVWPAEKLLDLGIALLTATSIRDLGLED